MGTAETENDDNSFEENQNQDDMKIYDTNGTDEEDEDTKKTALSGKY